MTVDELLQPFITWLAWSAGHVSEILTVTVLILQIVYITYGIIDRQRKTIREAQRDVLKKYKQKKHKKRKKH
jgi:hypothetical protein